MSARRRPKFFLTPPSAVEVEVFRATQVAARLSYAAVGASGDESAQPPGYTLDHNRARLGSGASDFDAACAALRAWKMFPAPWTRILPAHAPQQRGQVVAMLARGFGFWWLNACRIVYVLDETPDAAGTRRCGFAYGTLEAHVEEGEERFSVELRANGEVWYDLRAFSRPRYWPVRLAKPFARRLQRRFVLESQASMRQAVELARK